MSETSEETFPGFDSGDIHNLPATEAVTGTSTPQLTSLQASTSQVEAMSRQGNAVVPPYIDSPSDQTSMIREIIRKELRRGMGHRRRRLEREDSGSSSSSQEGSRSFRSSRSHSSRHSHSPSSSRHRRSSSRRSSHSHAPSRSSHCSGGSSHAPRRCRGTPWWFPLRSTRVGPPPRLPSVERFRLHLPSSSPR